MQSFRQGAVRSDADRLALRCLGDPLGMAVPVWFAQAEPVKLDAGVPNTIDILEGSLGVAVLPGIDARLHAALDQFDDALRRVPVDQMLTEQLVEVRISVNRVAAEDEPCDVMRPQLDG